MLKKFLCLFGVVFFLSTFLSCSRESSIKENVSLRNNHSVVFAFNAPFKDAEAFRDSIFNLQNPDSVLVYDTLTVTVNDSVYLMGFLRYNADKIYRYLWHFERPFNKGDSAKKDCEFYSNGNTKDGCFFFVENSANATPHVIAFKDTGVYSPLFVAVDGNGARDTAGIGQFIRVINTPPQLSVPLDTIWTRSKSTAQFAIAVRDSFGIIKSILVDLDASGKDSAKVWKTETLGDSLLLSIPYDSSKVDSLGNQKIYVIAIDDDENETRDSVHLHFNQIPVLKLFSPEDNSTQSVLERLLLRFEAQDKDNPGSLRYFVRLAPPVLDDNSLEEHIPTLTDRYLIAENIKEPYFVAVDADGKNLLGSEGRFYWDVWVTDGYDTVFAEKIKDDKIDDPTNKEKLRPQTFLLVNTNNPFGTFRGYVQYEGRSNHEGILVELQDSTNKYLASTDNKGYFSVDVPSGMYRLLARDTSGYGYAEETLPVRKIEIGQTVNFGKIILKDTIAPVIEITNPEDTLFGRNFTFEGRIQDFGSQVKEFSVLLDDIALEGRYLGRYVNLLNKWLWEVPLENLLDGAHNIQFVAEDSAGLKSQIFSHDFYVNATVLEIAVNDAQKKMVKQNEKLKFTAIIEGAEPPVDSLFWSAGNWKFKTEVVDGKSSLELELKHFPELVPGVFYDMQTSSREGVLSNKVSFGFFSSEPMVYFETPADSLNISINDNVKFIVHAMANNEDVEDSSFTLKWNCSGADCENLQTTETSLLWNEIGEKKVAVEITNKDGDKARDSILIFVVPDAPSIKISTDVNTELLKMNSLINVSAKVNDKFGVVQKVSWGCSNGNLLTFDNEKIVNAKEANVSFDIYMPGSATDNFKCIFEALDDDNETARDSITFKVLQDIPFVELTIQEQILTIKDEVNFEYFAKDTLGHLVKFEKACGNSKNDLDDWDEFSGKTTVVMPSNAGNFYCAIQVTDDDGNVAQDTATYQVLQARPIVNILNVPVVTIKDTVNLDAEARDSTQFGSTYLKGEIIKYEWGCGKTLSSIELKETSTRTPEYRAIMPSEPLDNYHCIIRITDDDENQVSDTTSIQVLLDAPTVSVAKKEAVVRAGVKIRLDASASDRYGEIVKREWSCGTPGEIDANWKLVSDFDTIWTAPAATQNYRCIARATDDDGNQATDIMNVTYTTITPVLNVVDEIIYVVPGQEFELNAMKNDEVWLDENVSWYTWQCYFSDDNSAVKNEPQYSFSANGNQFFKHQDSSYTSKGKDIYCVVSAEEASTGEVLHDTTQVRIINTPPIGRISAADTVAMWNGDSMVVDEGRYFYTEEWGGMKSTMGPIGDKDNQRFLWKFSNLGDSYYEGNHDGTLDTSTAQFNRAFTRLTHEGSIRICLDYRDSSINVVSEAFFLRHRAAEVCRDVYFAKAWQNLSADTVIETSKYATPPAFTTLKETPVVAYLNSSTTIATKYRDGNSWKEINAGAIQASDSLVALKLIAGGSDLFLSTLETSGILKVYKSSGGTSPWVQLGNEIEGISYEWANSTKNIWGIYLMDMVFVEKLSTPVIAYVKDKVLRYSRLNENVWSETKVEGNTAVREIKVLEIENSLAIFYVDTTYKARYAIYGENNNRIKRENIVDEAEKIAVALEGNTLYFAYKSRSIDNTGLYVRKGSLNANTATFGSATQIIDRVQIYHTAIEANVGKAYLITSDYSSRPDRAQTNVYHFDGSRWKKFGEVDLPYFTREFQTKNGYYLRGSYPNIKVSSNGTVYISMLGWEELREGKNFGPIVMKYVADNWEVHE